VVAETARMLSRLQMSKVKSQAKVWIYLEQYETQGKRQAMKLSLPLSADLLFVEPDQAPQGVCLPTYAGNLQN
jgi:arginine repressor